MPFYEYVAEPGSSCAHCKRPFTVLQKLRDKPLETCPKCGAPIRRLISPPHVVAGQAHRLQESTIEKAGFTQYRKVAKGVYEKTAGRGPGTLQADD